MYPDELFLERRVGSTELVILLHGFMNASACLKDAREAIRAAHPGADIYAPAMPTRHFFCKIPAAELVAALTDTIDRLYKMRVDSNPYKSIALVGHSIGAVFARKISIVAHGEQRDGRGNVPAPFEPCLAKYSIALPWAGLISRVVLLAGMNRGWSADSGGSTRTRLRFGVGQFIGELFGGKFTIFAIRRGAPFLVQTRLQWLALMNPEYGGRPALTIVQLLGTIDDAVAPDDSIDFATDVIHNAGNVASYNYLEVKQSGHDDIVTMSAAGPAATDAVRAARRTTFLAALFGTPEELATMRIDREQMEDTLPPAPDPAVANMVFVVHGIRDKGFWTKKIARTIKATAGAERFESWTESYGYFAMLPFLLRTVRQRKVEWLMDRYCEARARYPNAVFHYVGHSNGTYLAARALVDYPAARFSRIVFAGSVVRRDYDWQTLINAGRVDKVLNYVATSDWVVALFGKGLQLVRYFDIGSAGHDGFNNQTVQQVNFIAGGHGAAHEEAAWSDIAEFIVHGTAPAMAFPPFQKRQGMGTTMLGRFSGAVLVAVLGVILASYYWVLHTIGTSTSPPEVLAYTLGTILSLVLLRFFITRY